MFPSWVFIRTIIFIVHIVYIKNEVVRKQYPIIKLKEWTFDTEIHTWGEMIFAFMGGWILLFVLFLWPMLILIHSITCK